MQTAKRLGAALAVLAGVPLVAAAPAHSQMPVIDEETMITLNKTLEGHWSGTSLALDFLTGEFVEGPYEFTFGLISEDGADRAFWGGEFNVLGVYEGDGVMFESVWVGGALFQERRIRLEEVVGPDENGEFSFIVAYETPDPEGNVWEGRDELSMVDGLFTLHQQMRPAGSEDPFAMTGHFELRRDDW